MIGCEWQALDAKALARFVRFGYGHHVAAGLAILLRVQPEVLVKWLAMQDYVAITVASRTLGLGGELFEGIVAVLPWRDTPTEEDRAQVRRRFEEEGASGERDGGEDDYGERPVARDVPFSRAGWRQSVRRDRGRRAWRDDDGALGRR